MSTERAYIVHTDSGRLVGAVPSQRLVEACAARGEMLAYRISRDQETWCVEPDPHLGYRDTAVVWIDVRTVDESGAITWGRLGPARPDGVVRSKTAEPVSR